MINLHFLVFDGSSYFICSKDDLTPELEIINKSHEFSNLEIECDDLNVNVIS